MLQDGSLVASGLKRESVIRRSKPGYGSMWAGCSPPLSWPGRVPESQGAGRLFKDLGHHCSLLSAKIQMRTPVPPAAASPSSQMHGLIHSLTHPLSYSARIYHVLAAVWQAQGDIEMNNTRKAVVKELALWEGRKPNASLEESDRAQRQLGKGQVEGR